MIRMVVIATSKNALPMHFTLDVGRNSHFTSLGIYLYREARSDRPLNFVAASGGASPVCVEARPITGHHCSDPAACMMVGNWIP